MGQFQCFICEVISKDENEISKHMIKTHDYKANTDELGRKFSCSLCQFSTRIMNEFKNHLIKDHNKEEHNWMMEAINSEFSCDKCQLQFPSQAILISHIENIHRDRDIDIQEQRNKEATCTKCGKQVPNDHKAMMLHMSRAHNENSIKSTPIPAKPNKQGFECEVCDYKGRSKPNLVRHMATIHSSAIKGNGTWSDMTP